MNPINPILLIDVLCDTEEERKCIELQLRAIEQDPTSGVAIRQSHQNLVIAGEDELQLEAACERLQQTTTIGFGELRIGYRETIRRTAEAEGKYIRQTGGSGNYGHCSLRIEPNELGKGYQFVNEINRGAIPQQYQAHRPGYSSGDGNGHPRRLPDG